MGGEIAPSDSCHSRVGQDRIREARNDIPVTSPVQTLVDLATELDPVPLERAVNDADKRDLTHPEALRKELLRFGGEPGIRPLRHLLDKLFFRLSDSELEIYFRRIVRGAKLPMPLSKQRVNDFEVDFFWPELGLVVKTDGLRYHRTPSSDSDHSPVWQESGAVLSHGRNLVRS